MGPSSVDIDIAEEICDEWEKIEGESLRDGHRATFVRLIATAIQESRENGYA